MKNLTTRVPNYMQVHFPYSTVTSACQGSGLACTRTVTIFKPGKEVVLTILVNLNNRCMYIMRSVITRIFSCGPRRLLCVVTAVFLWTFVFVM